MKNRTYAAIDLKSFFASVACADRGLDPLTTNLVVADASRTEKTICLAVTPPLKAYGLSGRSRLFEVVQTVQTVNRQRSWNVPKHKLTEKSCNAAELNANPSLELDYIIAPPQMARYMEISTKIYGIYLKYIAPEDIHVYSIDEVFIDVTGYLQTYRLTARELVMKMIQEVLHETGITATAGIGTNLYLCKVAMDIVAKHMPANQDGVRIAELDEISYREILWTHRPLTDFWRVGKGIASKLEAKCIYTMGDIAERSLQNEDMFYKLFGISAELLIDHAWGIEPCTMADIKAYRPKSSSIGQGQVLQCPYDFEKGKLILREMTDLLVLELVDKRLVTDQMVLTVGYDMKDIPPHYKGIMTADRYGRKVLKQAHGSVNLEKPTTSTKQIVEAVLELYERIVNRNLMVRRIYIVANHIVDENSLPADAIQLDLFTDYESLKERQEREAREQNREKSLQQAVLGIRKKYGKNAILKGMNFEEGATTIQRNGQVGGHRA